MLLSVKEIVGTTVVFAVLVCILAMIVFKMIKNKKQGKSSCSCGCQGCAMKDICHSQESNGVKENPK